MCGCFVRCHKLNVWHDHHLNADSQLIVSIGPWVSPGLKPDWGFQLIISIRIWACQDLAAQRIMSRSSLSLRLFKVLGLVNLRA